MSQDLDSVRTSTRLGLGFRDVRFLFQENVRLPLIKS